MNCSNPVAPFAQSLYWTIPRVTEERVRFSSEAVIEAAGGDTSAAGSRRAGTRTDRLAMRGSR